MREIKFRAWDKENKVMARAYVGNFGIAFKYGEQVGACAIKAWNDPNVVIMQYVGLKDKNGKEIYEGDVLDYPDLGMLIVEWCEQEAGWRLYRGVLYKDRKNEGYMWIDSEIIGNIYENPELVEKKNE